MDTEFHARFSAVARRYFYLIGATPSPLWRRHRWLVTYELDVPRMAEAARALRGERDFSSFALSGSEPIHHRCRVSLVSLEWEARHGGMVVFRIEADRFLRGMVRSIVGTLVGFQTPRGRRGRLRCLGGRCTLRIGLRHDGVDVEHAGREPEEEGATL